MNSPNHQQYHLLIVDDDVQVLSSLKRLLESAHYQVTTATHGQEALAFVQAAQVQNQSFDLIISDVRMPKVNGLEFLKTLSALSSDHKMILMTAYASVEDAVTAMKYGAVDFLIKPFKRQALLELVQSTLARSSKSYAWVKGEESLSSSLLSSGSSSASRSTAATTEDHDSQKAFIRQVAPTEATVLLLGEVGCEQDQVAKQIHDQSLRAKQPFITFNARSLTEEQIELELWGAEKGSVAYLQQTKIGLFEAAHQGTLFIEGIDQCSSKIQSKFYHFFKYGEIRRLGSLYSKPINVRLIASTQVSLDELCEQGLFSRDLYYYFTVAQYRLQPLRKQKAIIPQLCQDLITDFNQIHHKKIRFISQEALLALQHYEWPGNQSELFHIIEGAVIHCSGEGIELQHLPQHFFQVVTQQPPSASQHEIPIRLGTPLKDVEDILIQKTLEATQGDKVMAAHLLGVHIRTIYRWLENRLENRPENQPENQLENQSNSIARSTTSP